jgi:lysophospholipase L1-like esterase
MLAHQGNVKRVAPTSKASSPIDYDVVFFGDDTTQEWTGQCLNSPFPDGAKIRKYFNETFTTEGGGEMEGLALGICGDSSSNLLWRLQHGELPANLNSKVFWLLIGTNDLARGTCSEEVTILGILRVAEEIAYHNPGSVVVIQGILPRSSRPDGSLVARGHINHVFARHHSESYKAEQAKREFLLWPSIQVVNQQLKEFCERHDHFVYFDANALFLGRIGNDHYQGKSQQIVPKRMPDFSRLSYEGHKVLGDAILDELKRIIFDDNENNDVEVEKKL